MPDEVKPGDSHVALTTIVDEDGTEQDIMRFNMPFGTVGAREFGTYFIGYASSPDVLEQMLTNMFCGKDGGSHDRILDFSTAVTGSLFFVPTVDFLEDPPAPPSSPSRVRRRGRLAADRQPPVTADAPARGRRLEPAANMRGSVGMGHYSHGFD